MKDKQLNSMKPAGIVTFLTTIVAAFAAGLFESYFILFLPIFLLPLLFLSFTTFFPLMMIPYLVPQKLNWVIALIYLLIIGGLVAFVRYKGAYDQHNIDLKLGLAFAAAIIANACLVHADLCRAGNTK